MSAMNNLSFLFLTRSISISLKFELLCAHPLVASVCVCASRSRHAGAVDDLLVGRVI